LSESDVRTHAAVPTLQPRLPRTKRGPTLWSTGFSSSGESSCGVPALHQRVEQAAHFAIRLCVRRRVNHADVTIGVIAIDDGSVGVGLENCDVCSDPALATACRLERMLRVVSMRPPSC